ncbi:MlaD family protein [Nocardia jiangxiensis]|uniref:MlaD family protein n=1 Tax=Nocardia jiangxiensis TaxID=282685 RepID=A0ABW6S9Q7_9NOCA
MRVQSWTIKPGSVGSLAAILLVLIVGIAYLTVEVLHVDPFERRTTARLMLANSGGLGPNAPVLLTGIQVGRVTGVHKVASGVLVEFRIDGSYKIPSSSALRIENLSALGEPYLEFQPKDTRGPYISNNQLLDTEPAAEPILIPQLSAKVVDLLNQLDPTVIRSLVGTMDTSLNGTEAVVPELARSTTLLAAAILSRNGEIRQLLTDMQAMGADMDWAGPALTASGPAWGAFGHRIDQEVTDGAALFEIGNSPNDYLTGDGLIPTVVRLTGLLGKLGPAMSELAPVIAPMTADMTTAIGHLDISALISQAVDTVGDDGAIHLRLNLK